MDERNRIMADIGRAGELMGACDLAAQIIEDVLTNELPEILKSLLEEDVITRTEYLAWQRRCKSVGAGVLGDVLALHSRMTARAKSLEIDVPPPGNGADELIERINNIVHLMSGGR